MQTNLSKNILIKKKIDNILSFLDINNVYYFNDKSKLQESKEWIKEILSVQNIAETENKCKIFETNIYQLYLFFVQNRLNYFIAKKYIDYCKSKKLHFNQWIKPSILSKFYQNYKNSHDIETGLGISLHYLALNLENNKNTVKNYIHQRKRTIVHEINTCRFSIWFIILFEPEIEFISKIDQLTINELLKNIDMNLWNRKVYAVKNESKIIKKEIIELLEKIDIKLN